MEWRAEMPKGLPLPYLRAWRQWRGLSQAELATRAGIWRPTVTTVENGKTAATYATIGKLAEALDISREALLHDQPGRKEG
jgi:transcriptional regulator with XRE-family HTH domain